MSPSSSRTETSCLLNDYRVDMNDGADRECLRCHTNRNPEVALSRGDAVHDVISYVLYASEDTEVHCNSDATEPRAAAPTRIPYEVESGDVRL